MAKREKLNIRLPGDPGPNPYDSKTPHQTPRHLTWTFWFQIGLLALGLTLCKLWFGGGLVYQLPTWH